MSSPCNKLKIPYMRSRKLFRSFSSPKFGLDDLQPGAHTFFSVEKISSLQKSSTYGSVLSTPHASLVLLCQGPMSEIHALNFEHVWQMQVIGALRLDGIRRSAELKQAQVVLEPFHCHRSRHRQSVKTIIRA